MKRGKKIEVDKSAQNYLRDIVNSCYEECTEKKVYFCMEFGTNLCKEHSDIVRSELYQQNTDSSHFVIRNNY